MMILNEICTDAEYMEQGFTIEEVPLIREHDLLFNKWRLEGLTEEENQRMDYLIQYLDL